MSNRWPTIAVAIVAALALLSTHRAGGGHCGHRHWLEWRAAQPAVIRPLVRGAAI